MSSSPPPPPSPSPSATPCSPSSPSSSHSSASPTARKPPKGRKPPSPPVPEGLKLATFVERPNRFLAIARLGTRNHRCHMPNPGRMMELLIPGVPLLLERRSGAERKTRYSVIGVWYADQWVSLDSTRGNREVETLIRDGRLREFRGYTDIRREVTWGASRFDLGLEGPKGKCLVEVKSCTLVEGGHARFPDAPTTRGARHVKELARAVKEGYEAWVVIFIPRTDARVWSPNDETDPEFGRAVRDARERGVRMMAVRFGFDGEDMEYLGRVRVRV